jgi:chemosensory pili system protein ChpA (sensor histidine kinase/response regulator)
VSVSSEGLILIVEDNFETRDLLQRVLAIRGHASIAVADAPQALARLRGGQRVSVIVLDIHLPGMDGHTFLRELRADPALAGLPVVAFSADHAPVPGVVAHVRKGTDGPDVLLRILDRLRPRE